MLICFGSLHGILFWDLFHSNWNFYAWIVRSGSKWRRFGWWDLKWGCEWLNNEKEELVGSFYCRERRCCKEKCWRREGAGNNFRKCNFAGGRSAGGPPLASRQVTKPVRSQFERAVDSMFWRSASRRGDRLQFGSNSRELQISCSEGSANRQVTEIGSVTIPASCCPCSWWVG